MKIKMKKQVFYIHGGEAYQTYDDFLKDLRHKPLRSPQGIVPLMWHQTLREDLGEEYEVFTPQMPNKQNARYQEWKIWFERHFDFLRDEVILLGWSLGGIFLAKYLSENELPFYVDKLILMAAPFYTAELTDICCGDFVLDPELLALLPQKVGRIVLLHAKDDFVVPYEHVLLYQRIFITASLISFDDKNHFLLEKLPEVVQVITE